MTSFGERGGGAATATPIGPAKNRTKTMLKSLDMPYLTIATRNFDFVLCNLRTITGIVDLDFRLAHHTLLPPGTQRTCHQSSSSSNQANWPSLSMRRLVRVESVFLFSPCSQGILRPLL